MRKCSQLDTANEGEHRTASNHLIQSTSAVASVVQATDLDNSSVVQSEEACLRKVRWRHVPISAENERDVHHLDAVADFTHPLEVDTRGPDGVNEVDREHRIADALGSEDSTHPTFANHLVAHC